MEYLSHIADWSARKARGLSGRRAQGKPCRKRCRFGAVLLLAALPACSPVPGCNGVPGEPELTAELFLGGDVGESDWRRFLDTEVTPRFPAGLSVIAADGQWRDSAGRQIREHSRLLVIVVPRNTTVVAAVEAVAAAYKTQFSQQSVGVVFNDVCAAF